MARILLRGSVLSGPGPRPCASPSPSRRPQQRHLVGHAAPQPNVQGPAGFSASGAVSRQVVDDLLAAFGDMDDELDYWVPPEQIEGVIPRELLGTIYRNGPGRTSSPLTGGRVPQPFLADGMAVSVSFRGGRAFFRNKHLSTLDSVVQRATQRVATRIPTRSGSLLSDWYLDPTGALFHASSCPSRLLLWRSQLLALSAGASNPVELHKQHLTADPLPLRRNPVPLADPEAALAPHSKIYTDNEGSETSVFLSTAARGGDALLTFSEVPHDGAAAPLHTRFTLPNELFSVFHDFAVTENYYVIYVNPIRADVNAAVAATPDILSGRTTIASTFSFRKDLCCQIHLIPRPSSPAGTTPRAFVVPSPTFVMHHINAFERDGHVVLDTIAHGDLELLASLDNVDVTYFKSRNRSELMRFVMDEASGAVTQRVLSHRTADFATINERVTGRAHTCIYTPAAGVEDAEQWAPNQVILKQYVAPELGISSSAEAAGGCEVWRPGDRCFTQECTFVPRPGADSEEDGWLLTFVYDAKARTSRLVILDARCISRGPVASIYFDHFLPLGMHSTWCDKYYGPARLAPQNWDPLAQPVFDEEAYSVSASVSRRSQQSFHDSVAPLAVEPARPADATQSQGLCGPWQDALNASRACEREAAAVLPWASAPSQPDGQSASMPGSEPSAEPADGHEPRLEAGSHESSHTSSVSSYDGDDEGTEDPADDDEEDSVHMESEESTAGALDVSIFQDKAAGVELRTSATKELSEWLAAQECCDGEELEASLSL